jgi:hypothetical protein
MERMVERKRSPRRWRRAGLGLAVCGLLFPLLPARGQVPDAPGRTRPLRARLLPDHFPPQPSLAPAFSIPVDPLGFSPPGPLYLGARNTLASLDFVGEDKLLFTFRVPGLLHRDAANQKGSEEREIRAVLLGLPQGNVEAETVWTLHDRSRYLWMLDKGHFLLRDRNTLMVGDESLQLKPFLAFPGLLLSVSLDPGQQYLVTNSHEPVKTAAPSGAPPSLTASEGSMDPGQSGQSGQSSQSSQSDQPDQSDADASADNVIRILHRDTGKVMLISRTRTQVDLPVNSAGYVENLRGQGWSWTLNLSFYGGGTKFLGSVDSHCDPSEDFVSDLEILVTACDADGGDVVVAMTTGGRSLWADQIPDVAIWPEITMAPAGLRIARETLGLSHAVNNYEPLDPDDIKGQWVTVYDAATGDIALETPASPVLDSGGNVAISPSGRRVAVLNAGAIQVFDLPAPPALPPSPQH